MVQPGHIPPDRALAPTLRFMSSVLARVFTYIYMPVAMLGDWHARVARHFSNCCF